jgi:hypothetical protein
MGLFGPSPESDSDILMPIVLLLEIHDALKSLGHPLAKKVSDLIPPPPSATKPTEVE